MAALALLISPIAAEDAPETTGSASTTKKPAAVKKTAKKAKRPAKAHPLKIPNGQYEPLAWHEIPGWIEDDHSEAFATFLASCRTILRSSPKMRAERGAMYRALFEVCGRAMAAVPLNTDGARAFFEQNFRPVRLTATGEREGFFTGYYEPVVEGARLPSENFTTPLYRRPPNLVTQRIRRSGVKGKAGLRLVKRGSAPYYDRTQIEEGAIAGRDLEICYVRGPVDGFFAEIQGSVRVRLEDGKVLRLNYADKNGHPYFAVGSVLVQRGIVPKEEMSMQKIREYMEKFPEDGKALRRMNRSYVFFRETDLSEFDEAIGAQGISLTAGRSIAVDRKIHTYGMPVFVSALLPIASEKPDTWFRRLTIAQDTGGAIIGPARADIYLGAGSEAERAAGRFKHFGQFVMLVPNELDPDREFDGIGLPQPRPAEAGPVASADEKGATPVLAAVPGQTPREKPAAAEPAKSETARQAPTRAASKPAATSNPKPETTPSPRARPSAASARPPEQTREAKPETPRPTAKQDGTAKPRAAANGNAKPDAEKQRKPRPMPQAETAKPAPAPAGNEAPLKKPAPQPQARPAPVQLPL